MGYPEKDSVGEQFEDVYRKLGGLNSKVDNLSPVTPSDNLPEEITVAAVKETDGLLALYRMIDANGTVLPDSSGNGNDGVISNAPVVDLQGMNFVSASSQRVTLPTGLTQNAVTFIIIADVSAANLPTGTWYTLIGNSSAPASNVFDIAGSYPERSPNTWLTLYVNNAMVGSALTVAANGPTVYALALPTSGSGTYYYNGIDVTSYGGGILGTKAGTLQIGGGSGNGRYLTGKIYAVAIYNRVLTAKEVTKNTELFTEMLRLRGVKLGASKEYTAGYQVTANNVLVADGDSMTAGVNANLSYTSYIAPTTGTFTVFKTAVSGYFVNDVFFQGFNKVDPLYNPFVKNVYVIWIGTNDLTGISPAVTQSKLINLCRERRKAGFKVIVVTMISRVGNGYGGATMDSLKNTYNAWMRANWALFADGIADVAANANLGADGAYANTTYFQVDQIHPNTFSAQTIETPIIQAAVDRLYTGKGIKLSASGYTGISADSATPVPDEGAGYTTFYSGNFYGWNGSAWKQLDN